MKNKVKRLVYSSSASVYGDAIKIPMTEDHPLIIKIFMELQKFHLRQCVELFMIDID